MENQTFEYTYSAQQQKEVEEIRRKYLPKEEDKMETLRKLHAIPNRKAQTAALTVGILGALILGTSMSLCMTELGAAMGNFSLVLGSAVGLVGLLMMTIAYPLYSRKLTKEREKIAQEILSLTDELLK